MDGLSQHLADHRFAALFRDELGWDRSSGTMAIEVDNRHLEFEGIAQKRGLQDLQCIADRRVLFNRGLLRRAQGQVARAVHEHILIYCCTDPPKQVWQWAVRMPDGRRLRHREHPFFSGSPPDSLLNRLRGLRFSLDDEADVTLVDALRRVRAALDVAPELNLFAKRPWYANRSDELAVAMAQGDTNAFNAFILLHRPLARHIAKRLESTFSMDGDDAEQIGVLGLIQAARRFNPERGYQFSTYASYWVRQAYQRYGPDTTLFIRLPAHLLRSFFPFRRHIEKLAAQFGPGRGNDELARLSMEDPRFFRQWLHFERALNVRSLSDRREPEYCEARRVQAPVDDAPLQVELQEERVERIRAAMGCLNPRHRRLLRLRYGMEGEPQTLEQIGRAEGITSERVRQILVAAERRLRNIVEREMKDLVPACSVAALPNVATGIEEEFLPCGPIDEPSEATRASIGARGSAGVSVLSQEEPQLVGLDLERNQETAEHVADAVGRQVAFHEEPVVDLEGFAE